MYICSPCNVSTPANTSIKRCFAVIIVPVLKQTI